MDFKGPEYPHRWFQLSGRIQPVYWTVWVCVGLTSPWLSSVSFVADVWVEENDTFSLFFPPNHSEQRLNHLKWVKTPLWEPRASDTFIIYPVFNFRVRISAVRQIFAVWLKKKGDFLSSTSNRANLLISTDHPSTVCDSVSKPAAPSRNNSEFSHLWNNGSFYLFGPQPVYVSFFYCFWTVHI